MLHGLPLLVLLRAADVAEQVDAGRDRGPGAEVAEGRVPLERLGALGHRAQTASRRVILSVLERVGDALLHHPGMRALAGDLGGRLADAPAPLGIADQAE